MTMQMMKKKHEEDNNKTSPSPPPRSVTLGLDVIHKVVELLPESQRRYPLSLDLYRYRQQQVKRITIDLSVLLPVYYLNGQRITREQLEFKKIFLLNSAMFKIRNKLMRVNHENPFLDEIEIEWSCMTCRNFIYLRDFYWTLSQMVLVEALHLIKGIERVGLYFYHGRSSLFSMTPNPTFSRDLVKACYMHEKLERVSVCVFNMQTGVTFRDIISSHLFLPVRLRRENENDLNGSFSSSSIAVGAFNRTLLNSLAGQSTIDLDSGSSELNYISEMRKKKKKGSGGDDDYEEEEEEGVKVPRVQIDCKVRRQSLTSNLLVRAKNLNWYHYLFDFNF